MNHDYEPTEFSKSIMAGVFAGIGATFIGLIFNSIFRLETGFPLSEMINVSTIIFMALVLMTVLGYFFYLLHHYFRHGTFFYQMITVLLVIAAVYFSMNVTRSPDPVLSIQFRQLLVGVIFIFGVFASFIIPYFFNSKRI